MVHPVGLAGFLVAVLPLVATPGAGLALLVQHVTDGGRRRALPVVLGTVTGLYVHAALAVAGLSALQPSRLLLQDSVNGAPALHPHAGTPRNKGGYPDFRNGSVRCR